MCFLHAINSDFQTRLLNVLGRIAMILRDIYPFRTDYTISMIRLIIYLPSNATVRNSYLFYLYSLHLVSAIVSLLIYNCVKRPVS